MLKILIPTFFTLFICWTAPIFAQTLSAEDQERVTIMQNAVKLRLPVTDLEVMFKYAFAMNKPALTLAGLTALSELPDHPAMITFVKDVAIKNSNCAITAKAISTIGQMGNRSQIEARTQAALSLNELSKMLEEKSLACAKVQPTQTEALNSTLSEALQKTQSQQ